MNMKIIDVNLDYIEKYHHFCFLKPNNEGCMRTLTMVKCKYKKLLNLADGVQLYGVPVYLHT
jgi:protein-disulfide isomerase